ncbi:hypothetical protein CsSME_00004158 [Camellia sinensis var. sinensis]
MELPHWTDIVKTGRFKELAPYDLDWYYIQAGKISRWLHRRTSLATVAPHCRKLPPPPPPPPPPLEITTATAANHSDRTKYYLLPSLVLHIKHSESKDSAVSQRILLSGPAGSEIYQEKLSKALAHHFGAKLLVFHSRLYPSWEKNHIQWPTRS